MGTLGAAAADGAAGTACAGLPGGLLPLLRAESEPELARELASEALLSISESESPLTSLFESDSADPCCRGVACIAKALRLG